MKKVPDIRYMQETTYWLHGKRVTRKAGIRNYGMKNPKIPNQKQKRREYVVSMYMRALGEEKLSEKAWKRIARVNQLVLDKY